MGEAAEAAIYAEMHDMDLEDAWFELFCQDRCPSEIAMHVGVLLATVDEWIDYEQPFPRTRFEALHELVPDLSIEDAKEFVRIAEFIRSKESEMEVSE
ncbi:MAG: hypothetical protein AAGF33_14310 [Pseudomonadota bacterium]